MTTPSRIVSIRAMVLAVACSLAASLPIRAAEDAESWARETLASLSLEQKVGQLLLPRLGGGFHHQDDEELVRLEALAREGRIGGVVVFAGDPLSAAAAVERLQRAAPLPLLVAADFEWGAAMRLDGATRFPRAMALGAVAHGAGAEEAKELAHAMGRVTGREALAAGIGVVLAPVLDVVREPGGTAIGTRSFGADPNVTGELGSAFARGIADAGALAVAKHFPGHGGTIADSHRELPLVAWDGERLRREDLAPFRQVFAAGIGGVMAAHVAYPGLDGHFDRPASRSPEILGDLLRRELGFRGLVFADALDMEGAAGAWDGAVAVATVAAGADLLLLPPEPRAAAGALVRAVQRGDISEERLDAAVERVLAAKARLGLGERPEASRASLEEVVADPDAGAVAETIAERALTLVADPRGTVPLSSREPPPILLVSLLPERDRTIAPRELADELRRRTPSVVSRHVPISPWSELRGEPFVTEAVELEAAVVFADYAPLPAGDRETVGRLVAELLARGRPVVYASLGDPWTLAGVPAGAALLATYDASPASQRALVRALFGETAIDGALPVRVGDEWAVGHGLARQPACGRLDEAKLTAETADPRFDFGPVHDVLRDAIAAHATPGAVAVIGYRGEVVLSTALGRTSYDEGAPEVALDTLYDLASLTKVVVTTTLAMLQVEAGRLDLEAELSVYLPELAGDEKGQVHVADLLAHSSGMLWWTDLYRRIGGLPPQEAKRRALEELFALRLETPPGRATVYSDLGILLLGEILERLGGAPLDRQASKRIFEPLGMSESRFRPGPELLPRIAPTELDPWRGRVVHGEVHDENAAALGGVAAHAGLFSTAGDLAIFAQLLLDGGGCGDVRLLRGDTIQHFVRRAERAPDSSRALGWDTPSANSSAGRYFSASSFGHTGFTGTSIWIDRQHDLFAVLLTNRVHPTRENRAHIELRRAFHDAVALAVLRHRATPRQDPVEEGGS